ncbi:MAG: hypothetical protein NTW62_01225 [Candidatus Nomurabacteria bacterium]|nr:hypothetical protein [Candidatus Nomurabacteria bacterium]
MKKIILLLTILVLSVRAQASDFGPETYSGNYSFWTIFFVCCGVTIVLYIIAKQEKRQKEMNNFKDKEKND